MLGNFLDKIGKDIIAVCLPMVRLVLERVIRCWVMELIGVSFHRYVIKFLLKLKKIQIKNILMKFV